MVEMISFDDNNGVKSVHNKQGCIAHDVPLKTQNKL